MQSNTNSQERTQERMTDTKSRSSSSQTHTGSRESVKPMRDEVIPQVGPKSVDPLNKRGASADMGGEPDISPNDVPEKQTPQNPGDHKQNPADPTRKEGEVTPLYANDQRLRAGEDLEEPTPETHPAHRTVEGNGIDRNPRNSGEVSKVY